MYYIIGVALTLFGSILTFFGGKIYSSVKIGRYMKLKKYSMPILGYILMAAGTYSMILGGNFENKKLTDLIREKDSTIIDLSDKVQALNIIEKSKLENRDSKIKTIATRSRYMLSIVDPFIHRFLSNYSNNRFDTLYYSQNKINILTKKEIIDNSLSAFMKANMLSASNATRNRKALSEIELFYTENLQLLKVANEILNQFGDINHDIISQIDSYRRRVEINIQLSSVGVETGVMGISPQSVYGNGVPEQYAEFFSYFFYLHYKLMNTCNIILNKK